MSSGKSPHGAVVADLAVADLSDLYPGAHHGVLLGHLRDLRRHLRQAVMVEDAAAMVRAVVDGLAGLVAAESTDKELAWVVYSAEAGCDVPFPGLLAALEQLRDDAACPDVNSA
ncbi:hypothetical protein PJI74_01120 [Mycobacterium kansasii]